MPFISLNKDSSQRMSESTRGYHINIPLRFMWCKAELNVYTENQHFVPQ